MSDVTVLIVGAGPTGMTLGIELARMGVPLRIVDKSTHLAQWSQALVVQARTLEVFQRYGIAQEAVSRGRKLKGARLYSEGRQIVHLELSPENIQSRYPYALFLPQSETEAILNAKMESLGVKTERSVELVSLEQDADGVRCSLRRPDGAAEQVHARFVVGCDGAHSRVRELTGIAFAGESIGLSFFLGDLELEGPDVPDDALSVHLHHGDVLFMARLTDRLTRLIVALHRNQGQEQPKEVSIADFQRQIDVTGVQVRIRSAEWMTPFNVNDRQAEHYRKGNVFLAGDASHIHSPVGGQGMNTGIQDAANLAWKLAVVLRGADPNVLDSYEQERAEVGKALLTRTGTALKLATSANSLLEKLRNAVLPLATKSDTLQRMIAGFVSETAICYADSPIVEERGGDGSLRGGDRMPDLSLKHGSLLGDWTDPVPLVVVVNSDDAIETKGARVVRVDTAGLSDEARDLLGEDGKVIVVRPDGYVGYRGGIGDRPALDRHLRRFAWR